MTTITTGGGSITHLSQEDRALAIVWADGHRSQFHYIWLRDNCLEARDPNSGQRVLCATRVPADVKPDTARVNPAGQVEIVWAHDGHTSLYEGDWLRAHCYAKDRSNARQEPKLWDTSTLPSLPEADYEQVVSDPRAQRDWLSMYDDYGFALLRGVPPRSKMVLEVCNMVSYVRESSWGPYFDVEASTDTDFLAYTNKRLQSHVDDAYFESNPSAQMLHCLVNDVEGGDSTIVDGFKIAADMKARAHAKFELLSRLPLHYHHTGPDYEFDTTAPLIRLDSAGEVAQVRVSNQSLQPFQVPAESMEDLYDAYCTFIRMAESDAYQLRFKLRPGDMWLLNNYRIMHGRRAFSDSGARHLQVCYVAQEGLMSRLAVLRRGC